MQKEHQETLLQTIKARLERDEKGGINFIPDINGSWDLISLQPNAPIVKYFTPTIQLGLDKFGNITNSEKAIK